MFRDWFYIAVIALTIIGVAIGGYPVFRMNRATIALVGSAILITFGAISLEHAYKAIDMNTIVLLFSMMVINVNLRLSGFFKLLANHIILLAKTPFQLLLLIIFASGILSGLFLNDTIVIMFTPLVLEIVLALKRNPIPYLIALATSANVGSVATIVGNPQNMIIGVSSNISFFRFTMAMTPIALLSLLIVVLLIRIMFSAEFKKDYITPSSDINVRLFKPLLYKSMISLTLMVIAFFAGVPVTMASLAGASILLFTRRVKPERVFVELDWALLVFFACLFIVTQVMSEYIIDKAAFFVSYESSQVALLELAGVSLILSNLISNVPAVMVLSPLVKLISNPEKFWFILALSSTFAGNLTLLGSVANLIVAEIAKKRGIILDFNTYLKVGLPVTVLTTVFGILWFMSIF